MTHCLALTPVCTGLYHCSHCRVPRLYSAGLDLDLSASVLSVALYPVAAACAQPQQRAGTSMNERSAVRSEESSRPAGDPGDIGVSDIGTTISGRAVKPAGSRTGWGNPDLGRWHEAGPAAALVGRRWALEVLRVLDERGPTRFNDLRRETGAAGQPLKATLEALARAGLVSRHVISRTPPPSVIYRLTPAACDLFPVLSSLAKWHRTSGAIRAEPPADLAGRTAESRAEECR
jgi:DNA-binding HxlR family transcriptional regulator